VNALHLELLQNVTRRHFLRGGATALGALWLGLRQPAPARGAEPARAPRDSTRPLAVVEPHHPARARHIIYLHMAGAPSQLELFQHKPELARLHGQDCPREFLEGKRFAFIRGVPQLLGPVFPFHQESLTGIWISDRLPRFERVLDKVCLIQTMQTDQFNHAPAQLLVHTGNPNLGHASMGAWATYGLGSENDNMPGFIVLLSGGKYPDAGRSAWGSGFLPSVYQGVQCRSEGEPVLYLSNPPGIDAALRGHVVDTVARLNRRTYEELGDPETVTRIAQYEMAYRMQISASDAFDLGREPESIQRLYGTTLGKESLANNCLLARRLVERGVRFVQLFDWGWDSHGASEAESLNHGFKQKCEELDRATAALLTDLDQRGLLDETPVVWGAEFGRTPMRENRGGMEMKFIGRDHHPIAFTCWLAGAGVRRGHSYGETDPIGYNPISEPVHIRDFQATLLHLLGLDHRRLSYLFQGLDQKLTGVKPARVVHEVLA
jgi:hypothetical protein